jgi:hypothetical protein
MTAPTIDAAERAMLACTTRVRAFSTGTSMDANTSSDFKPVAESRGTWHVPIGETDASISSLSNHAVPCLH